MATAKELLKLIRESDVTDFLARIERGSSKIKVAEAIRTKHPRKLRGLGMYEYKTKDIPAGTIVRVHYETYSTGVSALISHNAYYTVLNYDSFSEFEKEWDV